MTTRAKAFAPRAEFPVIKRAISFRVAMPVSANCVGRQRQLEESARASLERGAGRKLTDAEWAAFRAKLIEFTAMLRAWDQTTIAPERGNVEELCQRER